MATLCRRASRVCTFGRKLALRNQATVTTHEIQLDNTSQFLDTTPYRKHPGITSMNMVCLPPPLEDAAKILLNKCSIKHFEERSRFLCNFLWSRKRPVEDWVIQQKAQELERKAKQRLQNHAKSTDLSGKENVDKDQPNLPLDELHFEEKIHRKVLTDLKKAVYHWKPVRYNEELSLIYAAARLDGGYAAVSRALHEIKKRVPDFAPQTLLDFGSGTGTVTWAVHSKWGSTMKEYVCVDSSAAMNNLSDLLLRGGCESQEPHIKGVYFRQFLPVSPKVQFDLVVSAFSLIELPSASDRITTIQTLWRKTQSFLVLIENGTKEGHQVLMEARNTILKLQEEDELTKEHWDVSVFAPCPHALSCPKLVGKVVLPCNFAQSYRRLSLNSNSENKLEKFSFVILQRGPADNTSHWPRIVQPVLRRARHVHCHLCCSNGEKQHVVITAKKHGRDLYRCARSSDLGDRLPMAAVKSNSDIDVSAPGIP
ncbi:methyltransferase-like protein 17, mitochondrial isoform X1 [Erpetoichthys calabaricus]|uniref:methyltransferase-like protein 17, mitochondrial isoform X1 n=1 Tax=Erpetoichthys calabaricus TaxID=27687 RepID=UPI002234A03E|nr:methyltransferase-like protein 17, mitochondrial isoform X1 [Erpetoichthys calabaricus]